MAESLPRQRPDGPRAIAYYRVILPARAAGEKTVVKYQSESHVDAEAVRDFLNSIRTHPGEDECVVREEALKLDRDSDQWIAAYKARERREAVSSLTERQRVILGISPEA